jgi:hypothetical protein
MIKLAFQRWGLLILCIISQDPCISTVWRKFPAKEPSRQAADMT